MHPHAARAGDIGLEVVADHPGHGRLGVERAAGGVEVGGARLAEHGGRRLRRVLEPGDVAAGVEQWPAGRLPPAVAVQAVEVGAHLELRERAREVHVGEDEVRLGRVVRAADQDCLDVVADELDSLEVADERVHDEGEDAAAAQRLDGRVRGRLHLRHLQLDPHRLQARGEVRLRARRRVRDEAEPVAGVAQAPHRVGRARQRLAGDVQDAVHVEQNRGHDRRVYSRHAFGRAARWPRSSCRSPARAGPAGSMRRSPRRGSSPSSTSRPRMRLTDAQKRRVIARAGPVLRAVAQDERSQSRNRELAVERLVAALREALRVRAQARPHEADRRRPQAPPRAEEAALQDEAATARARLADGA